ncbi:hypothetical protein EQ832_18530 [Pseudomonas sp. ALS1131]|nr:hypothetical protein EQ832_18530 [Pseudomonas sp. ALS1131]
MASSLQLEKQLIRQFQGRFKLRLGHHDIHQALPTWLEEPLVDDAPLLKSLIRPHDNRMLP